MLKNAHLITKIGADTAENERNSAKNLQQQKLSTTLSLRTRRPAPHDAPVEFYSGRPADPSGAAKSFPPAALRPKAQKCAKRVNL